MEEKMDIIQFERSLFQKVSLKLKQILNLAFDLKEVDILVLDFLDSDILLDHDLKLLHQEIRNVQNIQLSFHRTIMLIKKIKLRYEDKEIHQQILDKIYLILWISVEDDDIFEYCEIEKVKFEEVEKIRKEKMKLWRRI